MKYRNVGVCVLLLICSTGVKAEKYAGIGVELGSADHDLSSESYPTLILEGRLGYKFQHNLAVEFEATATSGSTKSGEGTCQTSLLTNIPCSRTDKVKRQSISIQGVYNFEIGKQPLFSSLGLGLIKSSYKSTYDSIFTGSVDAVNEESTDALVSVNVGAIFSERHRASLVWNAPYGNSKTGEFSYLGISYNYIFDL